MKKFFKSLILIAVISFLVIIFNKYYFKDYNIQKFDKNLECDLKYKGVKNAVDFIINERGEYYIAYNTKIQCIDKQGKSYIIFSDKNMNITSIEYYKDKLYFASNKSVYTYDLHKNECKEIVKNLPNFGDYKNSIIKINGKYLYITIGAATNSGVVGKDNAWVKNNPYNHDISPYKIVLKGINFENGNNGAFANYGTKNIKGQIVPGHFPGNASIIMYNLETGVLGTYAWGIRNVNGMDFDSRGRIIASIGGMENRGARPIKGDTDYIYAIKQKCWYGWPDYSGGDPVNSPKFSGKDNKGVPFILDNHPTTNPEGPIYVHKKLNSLKSLSVDRKGKLGSPDGVYFYDDKQKKILYIDEKKVLREKIKFSSDSMISSIKCVGEEIIILDASKGNIYNLGAKHNNTEIKNSRPVIYFCIITLMIASIGLLKVLISTKR